MRADTSILTHYLEPLLRPLAETGVTEVVVNRPGEIGVEAAGGWTWREDPRLSPEWLMTLATAAAAFTSQDVTPETPICSTVLPGGERCQVVVPPATPEGTVSFTIRRPSQATLTLETFEAAGLFDHVSVSRDDLSAVERELVALRDQGKRRAFFALAVPARMNILISGATGSGKTTFAKGLIALIPPNERLITIEDARELTAPHRNIVHLIYAKDGQGLARIGPKALFESPPGRASRKGRALSPTQARPRRFRLAPASAEPAHEIDAGLPPDFAPWRAAPLTSDEPRYVAGQTPIA